MFSTMRFVAVVALLAGLTFAQVGTLPTCATECVTQFTSGSAIGGCNNIDIKCICSNKDFLSGIACCLEGKCSPADQQNATNYAINFCKLDGVSVPTAVSQLCTLTSSSSAPSSTSSSAGGAVSSSTSSSAGSSAGGAVSSSTSAASSVASQTSSSSSAAASATKNASPQNVAGLGAGVLGGLAAAVALL